MNVRKYILPIILAAILLLASCTGSPSNNPQSTQQPTQQPGKKAEVRIAALKGPTAMGMVKMMDDADKKEDTEVQYNFTMSGTADEITSKLVTGEIDIAAVPCNLASVLYSRMEGKISVAAINTLGVLYIVETGETIREVADLKGKTIYSTGKGTTPEYTLRYLLESNGIDPDNDLEIEYKSEATEVAALLAQSENAIAMLPQPFVTTAMMKNDKLRIALDVTEEWEKAADGASTVVTGVVIVRKEFLQENGDIVNQFLDRYKASTEYVNANVDAAAALVDQYGIIAKEPAVAAIPKCNITFVEGGKMQEYINAYLTVLFDENPQSVGGKIPDEAFYYKR